MSSDGTEAVGWNSYATGQSLSGDGRYLVFESTSDEIVAGDTNQISDVFLRDLQTGAATLISRNGEGNGGNGASASPQISADGNFVVFASHAVNLDVTGVNSSNGALQIYRWERATGELRLVSLNADGTNAGNTASFSPSISGDGMRIAYLSTATDLVAGVQDENYGSDVFITEFPERTTTLVSHQSSNPLVTSVGYSSSQPRISRDGSTILYDSTGSDLQAGVTDINSYQLDLVSYNIQSGENQYVTVEAAEPSSGNGQSLAADYALSADGHYLVFTSSSSDLVENDTNLTNDVFLRDNVTGEITLISRGSDGRSANGSSDYVAISADGNYAVFLSTAANLDTAGPSLFNGYRQVYRWSRVDGTIDPVSINADGNAGAEGDNLYPVLSPDGARVAFASSAINLITGMTKPHASYEMFLRDMDDESTTLVSHAAGLPLQGGDREVEGRVHFSRDGSSLVYATRASDMEAGVSDVNGGSIDLIRFDLAAGTNQYLTVQSASAATANQQSSCAGRSNTLSADGRYEVFGSYASDLVPGDSNGVSDVFIRDRLTGAVTLVSRAHTGLAADAESYDPVISADGQFVAFTSYASNLDVTGVNAWNGYHQLYRWERATGILQSVSLNSDGDAGGTGYTESAAISGNGSRIAFRSAAPNLVTGQVDVNYAYDVFIRDMATGINTLVSHVHSDATTTPDAGNMLEPIISRDGSRVFFLSTADDLTTIPNSDSMDLYVYEVLSGTNTLVNLNENGDAASNQGVDSFSWPVVSNDGRWVAYASSSTDLDPLDDNSTLDIYLRDLNGVDSIVVSVNSGREYAGNSYSFSPSISGDGRYIAFASFSDNLIGDDTNGQSDAFVYDTIAATTTRVSLTSEGGESSGIIGKVVISNDGAIIAFTSFAADLDAGVADANGLFDVFVRDWFAATPTTRLVSRASGTSQSADGESRLHSLSDDGSVIAFSSMATNLVSQFDANGPSDDLFIDENGVVSLVTARDLSFRYTLSWSLDTFSIDDSGQKIAFASASNGVADIPHRYYENNVYVHDATTRSSVLINVNSDEELSSGGAILPSISGDGSRVAFLSYSNNLVPDDTNSTNDAFVRDLVSGLTHRVSVASDGAQANLSTDAVRISRDGNSVVFHSVAQNLDPNVTDNEFIYDLFLRNWNAVQPSTTMVSVNFDGTIGGNDYSWNAFVNDDASAIAFSSLASNLGSVPDVNGAIDLFVYGGDVTEIVARKNDSFRYTSSRTFFNRYDLSDTGRWVVFSSDAPGIDAEHPYSSYGHIYLFDGELQTNERLSVGPAGVLADYFSLDPSISGDGRYVAFVSGATNLVEAPDLNGTTDVFVRDRQAGQNSRISLSSEGGDSNGFSWNAHLSHDGSTVLFDSLASNLDADTTDDNNTQDVFLRKWNVSSPSTDLVSRSVDGMHSSNGYSSAVLLSGSGTTGLFSSMGIDLTPANDSNDTFDLFAVKAPRLAIAQAQADLEEGDSGSTDFEFEVLRDWWTAGSLTVKYVVQGSGARPAAASDFGGTFPSGIVTFADGETSRLITIPVSGDSTVEFDETFTVVIYDPTENAQVISASAIGTIRNDDAATVASVAMGDGSAQRSLISSVEVKLNGPVEIEDGAFQMVRRGTGGGAVETIVSTPTFDGTQTRIVLTFTGEFVRGSWNALVDGNYQLTIDASKIRSGSVLLDGDGDGAAGGNYLIGDEAADRFFAYFGDLNGDRVITLGELSAFRASYGKSQGMPGYNPLFDYAGGGTVTLADLVRFRSRYGQTLAF